jgi:ribonuclease HI
MHKEEVRLVAWTDGGGDSTPDTEAYVGVLVVDEGTGKVMWEHGEGIGRVTHNEAEYSAVLMAVHYAIENGATHLLVRSDSRLVVHQINGQFRVTKRHLADYLEEIHRAVEGVLNFQIEWIPREENKVADELTRRQGPAGLS